MNKIWTILMVAVAALVSSQALFAGNGTTPPPTQQPMNQSNSGLQTAPSTGVPADDNDVEEEDVIVIEEDDMEAEDDNDDPEMSKKMAPVSK